MSAPRRPLWWRLFPPFLGVVVACTAAVGWDVSREIGGFHRESVRTELEARAHLLALELEERWGGRSGESFDAHVKEAGRRSATRVTVIDRAGVVRADSESEPSLMESHADRPEVRDALATGRGVSERHSATLAQDMLYVAVPLTENGTTVGVVRTALPLTRLHGAVGAMRRRIGLGALVVGVLGAVLGYVASRMLTRPLSDMRLGAERFAAGDFSQRLPVPGSEELAGLAEALNRMASELDERMNQITQQANERQAMLASMIEGVLAVDTDGRVINVNRAAAALLGTEPTTAEGRQLQEVVRNPELERLVSAVLESGSPVEGEVVLRGEADRYLQVHGAVLKDAADRDIGAVVVLNDVTRLRRLEAVRREFVANVSHELRTPVTSIKGFVETLRDGALDDPERAERFVSILSRQADRLSAIIDDLLALSRLEQQGDVESVAVAPTLLRSVLEAALQACEVQAAERDTPLRLECPAELEIPANAPLLEQAVVNLVDNAVKHSDGGSPVEISATRSGDEVVLAVTDRGCGIEAEHLPRIFERFYRVDRARSRAAGGTGLGLAIVKHVVQAHGGSITVESEPSRGSTFRIHLPA